MLIFEMCAYRIRRTQPNILTYAVNDAMIQLYSPEEVAPLHFGEASQVKKGHTASQCGLFMRAMALHQSASGDLRPYHDRVPGVGPGFHQRGCVSCGRWHSLVRL